MYTKISFPLEQCEQDYIIIYFTGNKSKSKRKLGEGFFYKRNDENIIL